MEMIWYFCVCRNDEVFMRSLKPCPKMMILSEFLIFLPILGLTTQKQSPLLTQVYLVLWHEFVVKRFYFDAFIDILFIQKQRENSLKIDNWYLDEIKLRSPQFFFVEKIV